MRRKKFTVKDWRESISLLIITLKAHKKNYDEIIAFSRRLIKKDKLSPKASAEIVAGLEAFCDDLNDNVWEKFLKKCRDKKYETNSSRKRLSVHSDIFDELDRFIKTNSFDNANQAIEYLLQNCSSFKYINRNIENRVKCQEKSKYKPVVPRITHDGVEYSK